eukprot:CAMPEP_0170401092 /NCGR_PEP_ID=MMETSP0117_2-20130122/24840_1 /TAXON_ID=400756 /ORGANISM="Durinskia baltica, Strain CSIRO CS-38" /LENGTH=66 /DNA_ID=CAMNT_0010657871 /DNA_START=10 /DNA_END=207 /DNA_ORIENTATION=-
MPASPDNIEGGCRRDIAATTNLHRRSSHRPPARYGLHDHAAVNRRLQLGRRAHNIGGVDKPRPVKN